MKRPIFQINNPAARKRLIRFRKRKRAFWSLCILILLYLISLGSELICNDKPLLVRCRGIFYSPILRFYTEDTFLHNGSETRPDYIKLSQLPLFAQQKENFMIFTPIQYGPYTTIVPDSIAIDKRPRVILFPAPRVGNMNIDPDYRIVRSQAAGYFMGTEDHATQGLILTNRWPLNNELHTAIQHRFSNQDCPPESQRIQENSSAIEISLSPYESRGRPPRSIRLTFREHPDNTRRIQTIYFSTNLQVEAESAGIWAKLDAGTGNTILKQLAPGHTYAFSTPIIISGFLYNAKVEWPQIRWPHKPTRDHWMGIDIAGRDVFARILYGLRISMTFGFLLVLLSMFIGIIMGAVQGYYGGRFDITTQRFIEIWSALPFLYIMILMGSIYGRSFALLLFCYGLFNWIGISYYIRAEFLRLRKLPFVDAAKCMGIPARAIMLRHIFPNALIPVITFFPFSLVGAIGALTALDYLGFGMPPPTPSWGELLQQAQQFRWAWWLILYPSLALFIVMLLGVFVGEGVRDAYDPRPYSKME